MKKPLNLFLSSLLSTTLLTTAAFAAPKKNNDEETTSGVTARKETPSKTNAAAGSHDSDKDAPPPPAASNKPAEPATEVVLGGDAPNYHDLYKKLSTEYDEFRRRTLADQETIERNCNHECLAAEEKLAAMGTLIGRLLNERNELSESNDEYEKRFADLTAEKNSLEASVRDSALKMSELQDLLRKQAKNADALRSELVASQHKNDMLTRL